MSRLDYNHIRNASHQNPLLDSPARHPGTSNQSRAAQFRTPERLRRHVTIQTPGESFGVQSLKQEARVTEDPVKLRLIIEKLGKTADRGIADSQIQRSQNESLRKEKRKSEKKDTHHLSHSMVLTQEAAIVLEEQRKEKVSSKLIRQRRNKEKKEAQKRRMSMEEYIIWYNNEKSKRPIRILRTQLDLNGNLEHIPVPESDDEWQIPTPPRILPVRPSSLHDKLELDEAISSTDLGLLFDNLVVDVPSLPKPPLSAVRSTSPKPNPTIARSRPDKQHSQEQPQKQLPYIPVPLPSELIQQCLIVDHEKDNEVVQGEDRLVDVPAKETAQRRSKRGKKPSAESDKIPEVLEKNGASFVDRIPARRRKKERSLVVVLKISGDKLEGIWRQKRRSMRKKQVS